MIEEKFTMKDWHIPFMLFELSSYAKSKEQRKQRRQPGGELETTINNFFSDDNPDEAMDLFWDNLKVGDEDFDIYSSR